MKKKILLSGLAFGIVIAILLFTGQSMKAQSDTANKDSSDIDKTVEKMVSKENKDIQPAADATIETETVTQVDNQSEVVQQLQTQPTTNYVNCNGSGNCGGINCQNADCPYLTQNSTNPNCNGSGDCGGYNCQSSNCPYITQTNNNQNTNQGTHHGDKNQHHSGEGNQHGHK